MRTVIYCFMLCLIFISPTLGEAVVWKVQSDTSMLYIGGTIHVLRESDYPLPEEFDYAYQDADIIVNEVVLEESLTPEFQQLIMIKGVYIDGTTLDMVLSRKAYNVLELYCTDVGIPVSSILQFKPFMVKLTLMSLELQRLGANQDGVDNFFYKRALTDGKKYEGLESVEEHIEIITSMGEGNESKFIISTIRGLRESGKNLDEVILAWRTADEKKINKLLIKGIKKDFPEDYMTLLVERNRNWLPKIEDYLQTPPKEFILVGIGHLMGEDGIIAQLKKRGYKIEKLKLETDTTEKDVSMPRVRHTRLFNLLRRE